MRPGKHQLLSREAKVSQLRSKQQVLQLAASHTQASQNPVCAQLLGSGCRSIRQGLRCHQRSRAVQSHWRRWWQLPAHQPGSSGCRRQRGRPCHCSLQRGLQRRVCQLCHACVCLVCSAQRLPAEGWRYSPKGGLADPGAALQYQACWHLTCAPIRNTPTSEDAHEAT